MGEGGGRVVLEGEVGVCSWGCEGCSGGRVVLEL